MNPSARLARRGDIGIAPFPFTDLSAAKPRPVLVLARTGVEDVVVAFITSQPQPSTFDNVYLDASDPEFEGTRLMTSSTIRIGRLATLHEGVFSGRLGRIGPST